MDINIENKTKTLDKLSMLESAYITSLKSGGALRRRLLDLGFCVGNKVTPLYTGTFGEPVAYSVMGSVIALRNITASQIYVRPEAQRQ